MMTATNVNLRVKAVVFSVYERQKFVNGFFRKLEERGVEIIKVLNPDKQALGNMPAEVTLVIAFFGLKGYQYALLKEWAKKHGRRYLQLNKNASEWPHTLASPNLVLVPPAAPSVSQEPVVLDEVEEEVQEAAPLALVVESPPMVNEVEELAKLYAVENAELRVKLAEATKTAVDPADLEQLTKTRQKNAAALAVKTKMVNKLEAENIALREENERLKQVPTLLSAIVAPQPDTDELIERLKTTDAELAQKRRVANEMETRMRQTLARNKELEDEVSTAKDRIQTMVRQRPQATEIVREVVKEVIVVEGAEKMVKLLVGLQTMVDEGMMTPEEAFKKLAGKYR